MEGSAIRSQGPVGDTRADSRSLAELLGEYSEAAVRDLAQLLGVARGGTHRALCERVARAVLKADRLRASLKGLSRVERDFLAFIGRLGGDVEPAQAAWWLSYHGTSSSLNTTRRLIARALLFPFLVPPPPADPMTEAARPHHSPEPRLTPSAFPGALWCPESIRRLAGGGALPTLPAQPEPPQMDRAALPDLVRDLFVLVRFLSAKQPRTTRTSRHLDQANLAELAAALGRPQAARPARRLEDVPELLWLESVALQAGLVEVRDRRLTATASAEALAQRPPIEQCRLLLEAASAQTGWGELEAEEELAVARPAALSPGELDVPPPGARVRARRRIVQALTQAASPGTWHRIADLAEWLMESGPDFLIRRRLPDRAGATEAGEPIYRGIRRNASGEPQSIGMATGWPWVEGAFVAGFLRAALRRVGVVDTAGDLFRLTDLGARVLGLAGETEAASEEALPPGRFFVQPNFEIIADGGGDNLAAVARLSQVADLVSFDRAALLKLSRESVCRALDQGLSSAAVMDVLSDSGRSPVSQNVAFSVGEWIAAYERYQVWSEAWVIEVDSASELGSLQEELPGCLERLGPTAARVLPQHRARVEQVLTQHPDVLAIDHAAGLRAVFDVDDRLVVTPDPSRWHWYPEHVLSQIADSFRGKRGGPRYRITRESILRALESGWTADEIEHFVEQCAARPLSAAQVLSLRGWLGRYGPVALAPAVLLRLPIDSRADILAVPELREALLGAASPSVCVVRCDEVAKVRRLLQCAGFTVEDGLALDPLGGPTPASPPTQPIGPNHAWAQRRWRTGDPEEARQALLAEVVDTGRPIAISYCSVITGEEPQEWVLIPERLEDTRWGLARLHARCRERGERRTFDVSRIDSIVVLSEP